MRRKNKKNKNLNSFIKYLLSILAISLFSISFLTIKNQCIKISSEIIALDNSIGKNTDIVKELQKDREYYLSEQYIASRMNGIMIVATPEPQIIKVEE